MDDIVLDFYVGKTMPETTHVLMVYTSHLWWFLGGLFLFYIHYNHSWLTD